ncbi:unnamed protein product, partial [Meganyctiphanes norvegica]
ITNIAKMETLLVLLALAHTGLANIHCFRCDNYPGVNYHDPACGEDNYNGYAHGYDSSYLSCYTNILYDGRVERGATSNPEEDGKCSYSGLSLTCYCKDDHCNNHLCQTCPTTIQPPTTTTTHPDTTTTQPPTTSI